MIDPTPTTPSAQTNAKSPDPLAKGEPAVKDLKPADEADVTGGVVKPSYGWSGPGDEGPEE